LDKKIKLILAAMILSSIVVFIVFLYIASVVKHLLPGYIALIIGTVVTITDSLVALYVLTRPSNLKKEK
jgi:hypothetical protein